MQLSHLIGTQSAAKDGVMMFDPVAGVPVFSQSGVWVPLAVFEAGRSESGVSPAGNVVFAEAFSAPPVVLAQVVGAGAADVAMVAEVSNVTATAFDVRITRITTAYGQFISQVPGDVAWLAVGV